MYGKGVSQKKLCRFIKITHDGLVIKSTIFQFFTSQKYLGKTWF